MRSAQDRVWWSQPTSDHEAHARAAGRRHYNALRREQAQLRRAKILHLLLGFGGLHYGVQAKLARTLGVSEATISRDLRGILAPYRPERCPFCGCGGHPDPVDPLDGLNLTVDLDGLASFGQEQLEELLQLPPIDLDDLEGQP